jgi:membrane-bound metal-dependent hydrolase YbcI (DUF457 family)
MSGYKIHFVVGLIFTAVVWALNQFVWQFFRTTSWKFLLATLPIVFLYSILPDLDLAGSKVTGIATAVLAVLAIWQLLKGNVDRAIVILIIVALMWTAFTTGKLTHRGHIHSLIFGVIAVIPLLWFNVALAVVGFIAFFSHLCVDSLTGGKWVMKLW